MLHRIYVIGISALVATNTRKHQTTGNKDYSVAHEIAHHDERSSRHNCVLQTMVQWPRCVKSNQCTAQSIPLDHIPSLRDKQLSAAVQRHLHMFCTETTHIKCCQIIHQCQITSHHTTNYMHVSGKKVLNWTINSEDFNYGSENMQNIMSIQWQSFIL